MTLGALTGELDAVFGFDFSLVAMIGVTDLVVIETDDVLLGRAATAAYVGGIDAKGNPIMISGNNGNRVREAPVSRGRIYAYVMPTS